MTQASSVDQTTGNILTFDDSITVPAPVSDVYRRWNDFPSFPSFMSNVQEVRPLGGNRYHWVARIFGIKQEWDAGVTENVPNQRISWRGTSGPYNAGTVSFTPDGSGQTTVRLRLDYAPPGGKVGQTLDQLTQTTRREVSEDLRNFKNLITGQPTNQGIAGSATQAIQGVQQGIQQGMQQFQQQAPGGLGSVLGPLTVPIGASVAGGVASYMIGKRLRESRAYAMYTSPVALPNAIAGWALTGASAASVLGSATLRSRGRPTDALFVGQWAPTFLSAGILARLLGHRGIQTNLPTSVMSWTYAAASAGSILASAALHARGKREDGLFVGQWAPTFLGAALFTRLFNRLLTR